MWAHSDHYSSRIIPSTNGTSTNIIGFPNTTNNIPQQKLEKGQIGDHRKLQAVISRSSIGWTQSNEQWSGETILTNGKKKQFRFFKDR